MYCELVYIICELTAIFARHYINNRQRLQRRTIHVSNYTKHPAVLSNSRRRSVWFVQK